MNTTIDQIKAELRDIIELSDKATPAPWEKSSNLSTHLVSKHSKNHGNLVCDCPDSTPDLSQHQSDSSFIAASRNLTPKMARALLTTIDAIETALHYAHFVEKQDYEELAKALETIRREWEVQA